MSNRKTWKSVGALLLTVAMLAGMLSVMGALPATAKTTTAMKFTADFSELSRIVTDNGGTFTDGKYRAPFTPASDTASLEGKFNTWANEKFYTYQTYSGGVRAYLGQDSNNLQTFKDIWSGNQYLAAGEDKVACGYLLVHARVQKALIHALVVAADQDKMVILCLQFTGHLLGQHPAAGGHIDGVDPLPRFIADMLPAAVQRICLHDRAAAAAVGIVIHLHLLVGGVVPYLVGLYGDKAPFPGTTDDGRTHHRFHRVGEQGHDVNSHRWPVLSSCVRE